MWPGVRRAGLLRLSGGADAGPAAPQAPRSSWCWRARQRDTARTAGGRSPGPRCAAARRAVGLASEGRGEKLPPRNSEAPRLHPGRLRRVTLAAHPSQLLAPALAIHGRGCQARRAGGAPL